MWRQTLWAWALACFVAFGVSCLLGCSAESKRRPDIYFLVIDALRPDHVGSYGYGRDTTPTLDALAEQGVVFTDVASPSSYTRATVASLFTSMLPSTHGVLSQGKKVEVLSDDFDTLAEVLSRAGYRTAAFMPNPSLAQRFNFVQGFELYDDDFPFGGQDKPLAESYETASRIHRRALDWLAGVGSDPVFMYLHYRDVHGPYLPPPPYDQRYWPHDGEARPISEREYARMPRYLRLPEDYGDLTYYLSQYDGEIRYTDDRIAEFLADLDARGRLADALIVITADHGEAFLEHGRWNHGSSLYQEEIHVPLMLVFPDRRWAGQRNTSPAMLHDLFPTLVEWLGLSVPEGLDGQSLLPALRGEGSPRRARVAEGRMRRGADLAMLRAGNEKLILDRRRDRVELYDLEQDPAEQVDLAPQRPERTAALRGALEAILARAAAQAPDAGAEAELPIDPKTLEELRALGYVD